MPGETRLYDLAVIRDLLLAAFTVDDLRRLVLYTSRPILRPLVHEFSSGDGLAAMVEKTVTFCHNQECLPDLLDEVKKANPRQYARFEFQLTVSGEPTGTVEILDSHRVNVAEGSTIYQYFLDQRYRPLAEHLIDFDGLIAERTVDFVGREFLDDRLNAFLENHDRGYFILVGEPGVGKTAWAAHVVREYKALHHFNVASLGVTRPDQLLENLSVQLIARYDLGITYLPPDAGRDGCYLDRLLHQAGKRLEGGKLLIVIDALNEVQMGAEARGANVLYLPPSLPAGVYMVLTRHPQPVPLQTVPSTFQEPFTLHAEMPDNQADLRTYLRRQAEKPEIAMRLTERGIRRDHFIEALAERSSGNFMYLAYLLPDIAAGQYDPLALDWLPQGLRGYYERFWQELETAKGEGREAWIHFHKPVIGLLAAAWEPVSAAWLGRILDLDPDEVADFTLARWRKFLHRTVLGSEVLWRIYHASFADFLREKLGGARRYHAEVADYYRAVCGGDWPRLAELDGGYGLRHYAAHLSGAERWDDLHTLVATGDGNRQFWAEAHYEAEGSYAGFLADLDLAWNWADSPEGWKVGRQIRYALIKSSIHTLAGNLWPDLVVQLVKADLWSPARALAHVSQMPVGSQRGYTLGKLLPYLPEELEEPALEIAQGISNAWASTDALLELVSHVSPSLKAEIVRATLSAAEKISNPFVVADILKKLAGLLSDAPVELQDQALRLAESIAYVWLRVETLSTLAEYLYDTQKSEILAAARRIHNITPRAEALIGVAAHLQGKVKDDVLCEALETTRQIDREGADSRARLLAKLAGYLPDDSRTELLLEALEAARQVDREELRSSVLSELAPLLPEGVRDGVLGESFSSEEELLKIENIEEESQRALRLSEVTDRLPDDLKTRALAMATGIDDQEARVAALTGLIQHLPDKLKAEALAAAQALTEIEWRTEALLGLANHLPEDMRARAVIEVLTGIPRIDDEVTRAEVLGKSASQLPDELMPQALEIVRGLHDAEACSKALEELVPYLTDELKPEALRIAESIDDPEKRGWALTRIAGELLGGLEKEALREALLAARESTGDEMERLELLAVLACHLEDKMQAEVLQEASFTAASLDHGVEDTENATGLVGVLSAQLSHEIWREAFSRSRGNPGQTVVLAEVMDDLPADLKDAVLRGTLIATARNRYASTVDVINKLGRHFSDELTAELLEELGEISDERGRQYALIAISKYLPAPLQPVALAKVLTIQDEYLRAEALSRMAAWLPDELIPEALTAVLDDINEESNVQLLFGRADHLVGEQKTKALQAALTAAQNVDNPEERACALVELAVRLPNNLLMDVLDALRQIQPEWIYADALVDLIQRLPNGLKAEVLTAIGAIEGQQTQAALLGEVASCLPDKKLSVQALTIARKLVDLEARTMALCEMIGRLSDDLNDEIVCEVWLAANKLKNGQVRSQVWSRLARHLTDDLRTEAMRQALTSVQGISTQWERAEALSRLVDCLPEGLESETVQDVLMAVRETLSGRMCAEALCKLAAHLPDASQTDTVYEALSKLLPPTDKQGVEASAMWHRLDEDHALALREMAECVPIKFRVQVLSAAIAAARQTENAWRGSEFLLKLVPHLPEHMQLEIVHEALVWILSIESEGSSRGQALNWMIDLLPNKWMGEGLKAAKEIGKDVSWSPPYNRSELFAHAILKWRGTGFSELEDKPRMWLEVLRVLGRYPRPELLQDLTSLAPLMEHLGDAEAIYETFLAVRDVSRWWP